MVFSDVGAAGIQIAVYNEVVKMCSRLVASVYMALVLGTLPTAWSPPSFPSTSAAGTIRAVAPSVSRVAVVPSLRHLAREDRHEHRTSLLFALVPVRTGLLSANLSSAARQSSLSAREFIVPDPVRGRAPPVNISPLNS